MLNQHLPVTICLLRCNTYSVMLPTLMTHLSHSRNNNNYRYIHTVIMGCIRRSHIKICIVPIYTLFHWQVINSDRERKYFSAISAQPQRNPEKLYWKVQLDPHCPASHMKARHNSPVTVRVLYLWLLRKLFHHHHHHHHCCCCCCCYYYH